VVAGPVGGQNLWSLGHDLVFTDNTLLVPPTDNYFAAGSKANMVDIQPCINSGILAGFNAVRCAEGKELIELPISTATGDIIDFSQKFLKNSDGGPTTFVSAHAGHYLKRLKDIGIFPDNEEKCRQRVKDAGVAGIFAS
jgi:hypothetical protein